MLRLFFSCLAVLTFCLLNLATAETVVKLDGPDAEKQWKFTQETASLTNGELVFDGMNSISKGFYLPLKWDDATLSAKFMVQPGPDDKVLACGFIIRAASAANALRYYYVHFDRRSAILVRFDDNSEWTEITRVAVPNRESGKWYDASLEIKGDLLTVSFDGVKLYDAKDSSLQGAGRIGFYGSQGVVHVKDIRVDGVAQETKEDLIIPGPLWVYVCAGASVVPGGYAAFPDVCRLQDGRLLSVFYAGNGHVSLPNESLHKGGYIVACYSSDEGKTWTAPVTIIDTPLDDRDPSIVQLADGRILCTFFTFQPKDRRDETKTGIVESSDNGKTWSEPRFLFTNVPVSQPIRVLSDGTLLMPLYAFPEDDGEPSVGAVSLSYDAGKTWSEVIVIPNGGRGFDAETDVIELKDSTLYAIQRPREGSMGVSYSKDMGKTWSVTVDAGFPGHCPYLLRTKSDVILLATRLPRTNLRISRDECQTWSESILVDNFFGAYPSMVELEDGSILILYYEEGPGSGIRARKFRVTDSGVEWQTFE